MIEFSIQDTDYPDYKSAVIYSEEDIDKLFLSVNIHGVGTKEISTRLTIHTTEEIIRYFAQKTGIQISDLVSEGHAIEFSKYLVLKLDSNIELLHSKRL